jgi:trimeric autotransporter adhesin
MTTPASETKEGTEGPQRRNDHPHQRRCLSQRLNGADLPPTLALACRWLALCVPSGGAPWLACALAMAMPHPTAASPPRIVRHGSEGLPLVAQGMVSAALGGDNRAYHVFGLRAINPAQRLRMRFSAQGVEIVSARAHVSLRLVAYGRGTALRPPGPASLSVHENRVNYVYGPFAAWFANGPRGLEQGFDVAAPPRGERGSLTFALTLSGRIDARLRRGALLLNGDGASLRYGGLIAIDAHGHVLRSWLVLAGDRLLLRVDDRRARYPLRIDPFVQQSELSDKPGASGEEFGEAVAVSGRTLVVGTIQHMANTPGSTDVEPGAAYVFTAPASGWAHARQAAILQAPRGQHEEEFGRSVAISGNTIVIGAPFREVGRHTDQGAAYVFVKPASGWRSATPTAGLTAAGGAADEFFGESVAISGNTVLVGAPGRKVGKHAAQGAVDVFAVPRSPRAGTPRQLAELTAPHGQANDALGVSVAISGPTIVAGADLHQVGTTAEQGVAYIFAKHNTSWRNARETAQLTDEHGEARELFGRTVAIWQNTVVVGAPGRGGVNTQRGAAYVFVKPASGWAGSLTQTAELTASDPGKRDEFGTALAISGGLIVAGAPFHEVGTHTEQGAAYVFVKPATGWTTATETGELIATGGAEGDHLGRSVALSGDTILLSAPDRAVKRKPGQGAVYAFRGD